jgi:hypothetical protein
MRKQQARTERRRTAKADHQLVEFERRDLATDIRASGTAKVLRRAKSLPTSIVLPPELVAKLRKKAEYRGIGYQTMLKLIVAEHVDDY